MENNHPDKPDQEVQNLVSAIIPVYNGERFLAEAIESVLVQDYQPIEVWVIDDGSTDKSAEIAKRYPDVHYAYQTNQGVSAALNHGLKLAGGSFFSFLDADDIWLRGKLSRQMGVMLDHPELEIVFGHFRRFVDLVHGSQFTAEEYPEDEIVPGYLKITALIRKESFWKVGWFDTNLNLGDFIDWFSRAKHEGLQYMMLPEVLALRRVHGENTSYLKRNYSNDYVRVMKAALDRRRNFNQSDNKIAGNEKD